MTEKTKVNHPDLSNKVLSAPHIVFYSHINTYGGEEGHCDHYTVHWLAVLFAALALVGLGRFVKGLVRG